jgi:hypothetical protein
VYGKFGQAMRIILSQCHSVAALLPDAVFAADVDALWQELVRREDPPQLGLRHMFQDVRTCTRCPLRL